MIDGFIFLNLFVVIVRLFIYSRKNPKPSNTEELSNYLTHIVSSTIIWFIFCLIFFAFGVREF